MQNKLLSAADKVQNLDLNIGPSFHRVDTWDMYFRCRISGFPRNSAWLQGASPLLLHGFTHLTESFSDSMFFSSRQRLYPPIAQDDNIDLLLILL